MAAISVNAPAPIGVYSIALRYPEDLTPGGRSRVITDLGDGLVTPGADVHIRARLAEIQMPADLRGLSQKGFRLARWALDSRVEDKWIEVLDLCWRSSVGAFAQSHHAVRVEVLERGFAPCCR
jgi:hypothetical protein